MTKTATAETPAQVTLKVGQKVTFYTCGKHGKSADRHGVVRDVIPGGTGKGNSLRYVVIENGGEAVFTVRAGQIVKAH